MTAGRAAAAALAWLLSTVAPEAAGPMLLGAPPGATSCSGCHGVDARADPTLPAVYGRPAAEIVSALAAFRSGGRPATVMNRIATGFTEDESRAMADWLSRQGVRR